MCLEYSGVFGVQGGSEEASMGHQRLLDVDINVEGHKMTFFGRLWGATWPNPAITWPPTGGEGNGALLKSCWRHGSREEPSAGEVPHIKLWSI